MGIMFLAVFYMEKSIPKFSDFYFCDIKKNICSSIFMKFYRFSPPGRALHPRASNPPRPLASWRVDGWLCASVPPSHSLFLQTTATKGRGTLPFPSLQPPARRGVGGVLAVRSYPIPPGDPSWTHRIASWTHLIGPGHAKLLPGHAELFPGHTELLPGHTKLLPGYTIAPRTHKTATWTLTTALTIATLGKQKSAVLAAC